MFTCKPFVKAIRLPCKFRYRTAFSSPRPAQRWVAPKAGSQEQPGLRSAQCMVSLVSHHELLVDQFKQHLLVTASHHLTLLARLFNLDKAPHIMHRAPCSVLVYQGKST